MRLLPAVVGPLIAIGAYAHPEHGHHLEPGTVMTWWSFDPLVILLLAASAFLFVRGTYVLWGRAGVGRGVTWWHVAAFSLGWLTLLVALISPVDTLGSILFSVHMAQHELLMVVAAPLLVLARPLVPMLWALSEPARVRAGRIAQGHVFASCWHAITGPFTVLLLHGVAIWVWHIPALYQATLRNEAVHAVQHSCFFLTALLFWWSLMHGRYGRVGYGAAVAYVFLTAVHTSVLGALLTVAPHVWYPIYEARTAAWGLRAIEDQQMAGLLMWVPSGIIFTLLGLGLFVAWLGEAERRVRLTAADRGAAEALVRSESVE